MIHLKKSESGSPRGKQQVVDEGVPVHGRDGAVVIHHQFAGLLRSDVALHSAPKNGESGIK
jgi:hypothetical protein